jgi:UDP-glucose 4-epimerase
VPFVSGDLADAEAQKRALDGVEAVIHFAAFLSVGESVAQPAKYYQNNTVKALSLLNAMVERGIKRFIFSSTCATYGTPVHVPIDENHPQDPINPYGASKRAFERALLDYSRAGLVRAIALRYFNAAGCHPDGSLGEDHNPEEHIIPLAIDAALGRRPGLTIFGDDYDTPDGTCIRDYIHVTDLGQAHVLAMNALESGEGYRYYNLGSENGYSVREVIKAVEKVSGLTVPASMGPRRPGDPPRLVASAKKVRSELGWSPKHSDLETIIDTALRWRRDHPQGWRLS